MKDTITHHGPDLEGYHIADSPELGFRRLSIIDLSGENVNNHKVLFSLIVLERWMGNNNLY
jgi:asparagine synthetase B (glutamine-hydrolysing)